MQQFAKVSDIGVSWIYENSLAWQYLNNEEYMNCLKEIHHGIRDYQILLLYKNRICLDYI